ncbi:hypothetical protein M0R45_025256 [Rubus argutus]|uniref:Uncharacterized protein n=1 Tax=Rubus argutus TaxID=59490 RepID=A0AAW1WTW9_RUBAR
MFGVTKKPSIRTLFPNGFRLLNVLDLHSSPLKKFPVEIVDLYFLKYLSLRETKLQWKKRRSLIFNTPFFSSFVASAALHERTFGGITPLDSFSSKPCKAVSEMVYCVSRLMGFRKLKILSLDKFNELRCIEVEMGAMDCLEKLSIQRFNVFSSELETRWKSWK